MKDFPGGERKDLGSLVSNESSQRRNKTYKSPTTKNRKPIPWTEWQDEKRPRRAAPTTARWGGWQKGDIRLPV